MLITKKKLMAARDNTESHSILLLSELMLKLYSNVLLYSFATFLNSW